MKTLKSKQILLVVAATIVGCLCGYFIDANLFQINPIFCCLSEGVIFGGVQTLISNGVI